MTACPREPAGTTTRPEQAERGWFQRCRPGSWPHRIHRIARCPEPCHQAANCRNQRLVRRGLGLGTRTEQVHTGRNLVSLGFHKHTKSPPKAISLHCGPERPAEGIGHLRPGQRWIEKHCARQRTDPQMPAFRAKPEERTSTRDLVDQALSRYRPLARRAFSTARPARVDIRWRNPCFRALRRLLG